MSDSRSEEMAPEYRPSTPNKPEGPSLKKVRRKSARQKANLITTSLVTAGLALTSLAPGHHPAAEVAGGAKWLVTDAGRDWFGNAGGLVKAGLTGVAGSAAEKQRSKQAESIPDESRYDRLSVFIAKGLLVEKQPKAMDGILRSYVVTTKEALDFKTQGNEEKARESINNRNTDIQAILDLGKQQYNWNANDMEGMRQSLTTLGYDDEKSYYLALILNAWANRQELSADKAQQLQLYYEQHLKDTRVENVKGSQYVSGKSLRRAEIAMRREQKEKQNTKV